MFLPPFARRCLPLSVSLSFALSAVALAAPPFEQPDGAGSARVLVKGVTEPGQTAQLQGSGFQPGAQVYLSRAQRLLGEAGGYRVAADGRFVAEIAVPETAPPGLYSILAQSDVPGETMIFPLKVSPHVPQQGSERITMQQAAMPAGLYQAAYSPAQDAIFLSAAVGRPPVTQSQLIKVDPETLAILAQSDAASMRDGAAGQKYAVYGIGVDDPRQQIWVTNTRDDTLAIYRSTDLSLVAQLPRGSLPHGRDVVVDAKTKRAFASGADGIYVFDAETFRPLGKLSPRSQQRGAVFAPASLALDAQHGKLYTVSLNSPEAAQIDVATLAVERILPLPGARGAIGVAVDGAGQRLFTAAQGSDQLLILDLASGALQHAVATGAGALNVAYDPVHQLAYVANRGADSITVVDADGRIVANLDGGSFPNHLTADGRGHIFAVNKARGSDDPRGDQLRRLQPSGS